MQTAAGSPYCIFAPNYCVLYDALEYTICFIQYEVSIMVYIICTMQCATCNINMKCAICIVQYWYSTLSFSIEYSIHTPYPICNTYPIFFLNYAISKTQYATFCPVYWLSCILLGILQIYYRNCLPSVLLYNLSCCVSALSLYQ